MKFYYCDICGNLVYCQDDLGSSMTCCGQKMRCIEPTVKDPVYGEKHLPVVNIDGNTVNVKVGSTIHPSEKSHFIKWIALVTSDGVYTKYLFPEEKPEVNFVISDCEEVIEVYAYCNIHGLYKTSL